MRIPANVISAVCRDVLAVLLVSSSLLHGQAAEPIQTKQAAQPAGPKTQVQSGATSATKPNRKKGSQQNKQPQSSDKPNSPVPATNAAPALTMPTPLPNPNTSPIVEGDYVPCKFTVPELRSLVTPEVSPVLTEADENTLKMQVYAAAQNQTKGALANGIVYQEFMRRVSSEVLTGLTPSQALNRIVLDLSDSKNALIAPAPNGNLNYIQERLPIASNPSEASDFKKYLSILSKIQNIETLPLNQLQQAGTNALNEWKAAEPKPADSSVQDIQSAIESGQPPDFWAIVNSARASLETLQRPSDVGCAMSILSYRETDTAFGFRIAREYIAIQIVVRNLSREQPFALHDAEFQVNVDPEGRYGRFFSGRDKVIVRALSAAQSSFDPRALVVHGSQLIGAIASATVPIFSIPSLTNSSSVFNGAFTPGLDKFWKDESADQLNLLNDTGFSSQLSSQTTVPELGTVVFVIFVPAKQFEEGWWTMPCVDKVFVGHENPKGQVTLPSGVLDNSSSSASQSDALSASKINAQINVARALEVCTADVQQPKRIVRHWWEFGLGPHYSDDNAVGRIAVSETTTGGQISPVNKKADSDEQTQENPDGKLKERKRATQCTSTDLSGCGYDLFRNAYPRPYRIWSANAIQIFSALSNAIISGAHTTEDTQSLPSITALNCPTDSLGNLQFPSPDKGTIQCTMTGKNLDKVNLLRLRDAKDATDVTTAEGKVTVSGDPTSGTVEFQTSALHNLPQPAYIAYAVSSRGVETKTGQTIHLAADPVVSSPPSPIDFTKDNGAIETLTISGYHLDQVDTIVLTNHADSNKSVEIPLTLEALKSPSQLNILLDATKVSALGTSKITVDITFKAKGKPIGASPATSISFTGPSAPNKPDQKIKTPPNQPPASNGKAKGPNPPNPAP